MSIAFIQEIDYCVQVTSPSNTSSKAHVILILLHCSDYTILNTTDLPLPPFLLNIVNVYAVQIHNLLRPFDKAVSSTPLPNRHSMSTQRLSHSQRRKGDIQYNYKPRKRLQSNGNKSKICSYSFHVKKKSMPPKEPFSFVGASQAIGDSKQANKAPVANKWIISYEG